MTEGRDIQPALAHLESALEASCATLMALQAGVVAMPEGARDAAALQTQLERAIRSVRAAIAEMRAVHDVETSALAFGFVLGADPAWSRPQDGRRQAGEGQVSPRRTA